MKKYIYSVGAFALAFAMSGMPALALAENGDGGVQVNANVTTQVTTQSGDGQEQQSSVGGSEGGSETSQSTTSEAVQAEASQHANEQASEGLSHEIEKTIESMKEGLPFNLESTTTAALSLGQLQQSIKLRGEELDQEEASSSPDVQEILKNANPVRLAVHSLLASKDLLGGIGSQVSVIAQQMNDSVASTTNAEAQIQSRGFLTKLLFGGDRAAAQVIAQAVAQNQQHIDDLNTLLAQANVAADVQVTLKAQIVALQEAQTRLQDLAKQEQGMWGIFSWRF